MVSYLLILSLLLLYSYTSSESVHHFTHNGPRQGHVIQTEFDHLRKIANYSSQEARVGDETFHGNDIRIRNNRQVITAWNINRGKGMKKRLIEEKEVIVSRAKRGFFIDKEPQWENGKGRIVERNPSPSLLQQFGNGLNDLTKGIANQFGLGGNQHNNQNNGRGGGVGQINDVSNNNNNNGQGFLSSLANNFKNFVQQATAPANFDAQAREFCRQYPQNDKCRGGRIPGWNEIRDMIQKFDSKVRQNLPIPKMYLKDPLAYVPEIMKTAVSFIKQKWGELSAMARSMISEVCRTRVNCQVQTERAINLKSTLKDKLRQFRLLFGIGSEKELEEQFERTQQVKRALLARAGLDKEVEPADDGVFDSDLLLTSKQSELLLNQFGQGGRQDVDSIPEAPTQKAAKRAAIFFEDQFFEKWDVSRPIPYLFDSSLAAWEQTDVRDALNEISSKTCIRFSEERSKPNGYHINYVKIQSGSFCGLSYIGRTSPANPIYLSFACGETKGVAMHETLHALGLAHEHVRSDRDQHIKVDWSNIDPRYYDAFAISDARTFTTYGIQYDYGSIMHYRSNSAAINVQKPTMIPLVNEAQNIRLLGQRKGLSANDVELLNRLYCKPDSCIDTNVYCGAWALQGVCTRSSNNIWMSNNCRKSCGLC